ncbi:hypothetical protein DKY63_23285 [Pseudomonas putida]|uniref:Uncharacterized protein n=1 Tax=Pseudomonas putida TaxID=303 RepID=A0A2Z4RTN4_PSEPU|nr:hypothetical protein DKY63_23285 [Pseudomonas putida]
MCTTQVTVGASLLAIAVGQAASLSTGGQSSRASSLPQGQRVNPAGRGYPAPGSPPVPRA